MASAVVFPDSLLPQEKSRGHAQEKMLFKSYEELPLTLSVPEMAAALGLPYGSPRTGSDRGLPGTENRVPHRNLQERALGIGEAEYW